PRWLAAVHPRFAVPHRAEVVVAVVVCALVLTVDLRGAIGFSSFGVLLYYAVANAAAVTQTGAWRLSPRALQVAGLAGCLVLAATLPTTAVLGGLLVLAAGVAYRAVGQRVRRAWRPRSGGRPGTPAHPPVGPVPPALDGGDDDALPAVHPVEHVGPHPEQGDRHGERRQRGDDGDRRQRPPVVEQRRGPAAGAHVEDQPDDDGRHHRPDEPAGVDQPGRRGDPSGVVVVAGD